ncbi:MAG: hypothetical protein ABSB49_06780 [Polyangia bacterium]|jgi:hypothetical protein
MNIAALAHRFFVWSGALLVAIAALQWYLGRREGEPAARRSVLDTRRLRMLMFATVGVLAILVGAGVIPMGRLR